MIPSPVSVYTSSRPFDNDLGLACVVWERVRANLQAGELQPCERLKPAFIASKTSWAEIATLIRLVPDRQSGSVRSARRIGRHGTVS